MGEYKEAEESLNQALEEKKKFYQGDHPSIATTYNNLGYLFEKMEEYSKALEMLEKAITI